MAKQKIISHKNEDQDGGSALNDGLGGWKPIETIPEFRFVWAYCQKAHETKGAASETNGGMVVCYRPSISDTRREIINHDGIPVNWDFTHWMELPLPPRASCDRHNFVVLHPSAGDGTYCTQCGFTILFDD